MKLEEYKLIFTAVGFIGVLVLATPALGAVIRFPGGEQFSELYVLGSEHMAQNYPNNIAVGQNYSLYLGVGNHLGSSAYYTLAVKLLNPSDTLPIQQLARQVQQMPYMNTSSAFLTASLGKVP
jgi:uncharacterized membrane protein